ncbi:MAG: SDR family oxidoreductase [Proteobacteria bacterium]|nr:MAG: SDR family oxidoreductase [Pseudomonadota bacterium]
MTKTLKTAKKRVLVAGGAGFIGSHLCESFLSLGWTVICIDNFYTGQKKNIEHLLGNKNFELIRHDIVEPILLEVDLVLNFACPASPVHYQTNPIKTMKTSVLGTMNLLGLAKRTGARYVQASTSEVYGDPQQHPQQEEYWGNVNPIGPRSCYDEGKRAAETLCFDYHRMHDVDIRVVRIFNTYGPRMDANDGRVVSNFIVQALKGNDLTMYGDGSQTRSFCYVDDLVRGIIAFALQDQHIGPMNLGNDKEFTVAELAEKVLSMTSSKSKLVRLPLPTDDPKVRRPDLSKAQEYINYSAKVDLTSGLEKTIEYFKSDIR